MGEIKSFDEVDDLVKGFMSARVILTAVYIDVFTKIGDSQPMADSLAEENQWDDRATTILLDSLCALGFLSKNENKYSNTAFSNRFLRKDKPEFKGWGLLHRNTMWLGWSNLTEIVTNKPFERPSNTQNKEFNTYFINAMWQFHYEEGLVIADMLETDKIAKMADIAGGPGCHSIAFAQKNQKLISTIVDLANTLVIAEEKIKEHKLQARIDTHQCDVFKEPINLKQDYDFVLISNLFHAASEEDNINLLKKINPILKPGGRVVINEFPISDDKTTPVESALFSVNMLVQTENGNTYPQSQIKDWLIKAGFKAKTINEKLTQGSK